MRGRARPCHRFYRWLVLRNSLSASPDIFPALASRSGPPSPPPPLFPPIARTSIILAASTSPAFEASQKRTSRTAFSSSTSSASQPSTWITEHVRNSSGYIPGAADVIFRSLESATCGGGGGRGGGYDRRYGRKQQASGYVDMRSRQGEGGRARPWRSGSR
ncbi:unnamed protein product [Closterium sp. NIES-53]